MNETTQDTSLNHPDAVATIYAVATGRGGAIGIIRLSGPNAINATDAIFRPAAGLPLKERHGQTLTYGTVSDGNEIIDDVVVSLYRSPHSYTGEDCIELSCHNSPYILGRIMQLLSRQGCRLAEPGEYTRRAFQNGKMDLSQAEAVADLIAADSAAAHHLAISQMRGGYSKKLNTLRDSLIHIASLMELELDFSDHEELEFADRTELRNLVEKALQETTTLSHSFKTGNAIKQGIPVAIVGKTNVGKSTLLNALLGEERAIVSNIRGTTRDSIEDTMTLGGLLFRFIDTAGLRQTTDSIEQMGIERTHQIIRRADILLWMVAADEGTEAIRQTLKKIGELRPQGKIILIVNKADLLDAESKGAFLTALQDTTLSYILISARNGAGLDELKKLLLKQTKIDQTSEGIIVSNQRHYEALQNTNNTLRRVLDGLNANLPTDLVTEDLRDAIQHLGEITGAVSSEDILHNIFQHFCIGK